MPPPEQCAQLTHFVCIFVRKKGWLLTTLKAEREVTQRYVIRVNASGKEAGGER